jgi:serine/threonine-protein kinase
MTNVSWVGQTLSGRYHVEELLGHGGMSSVYKATDPNLHRTVAIKMIHPHLSSDPDFLRRFEDEAAMVAQLRHEGIVQVYDFNHEGDVYYMVLEYLPGETLESRLKRLNEKNQKMDPAEVVKDIAQICDAVQYAHQKGLIHRDIKPANIMLAVYGKAVLMDFGIARMVGGSQHTATGAVIGTAKYMSPEQIKGEKVDGRSDIYSLGVTLFEAVSGKPPFEADSVMTLMMMQVNNPVPNIRELQPHVPDSLVSVIDKAMEKKPENRYTTAAEMAAALRGVYQRLTGEVIQPPVSRDGDGVPSLVEPPVDQTYAEQTIQVISHPPRDAVTSVELAQPAQAAPEPVFYSSQPDHATGSVPEQAKHAVAEPVSGPAGQPSRRRIPLFIGIGLLVALLLCAVIAYSGFSLMRRSNLASLLPPTAVVQTLASTAIPTVDAGGAQKSTQTSTAVVPTPAPLAPTGQPATAVPLAAATSTINPNEDTVRIDNITIQDGRYVVDYETFGFTEALPGTNIHFFFNTVPPDQAGVPGKGPWAFFGGPRPFKGYAVANRPQGATQMCALVANADHTVQPQSGNCFNLPNP